MMKRTVEEIFARIAGCDLGNLQGFDFMGFERSDLIQHLPFEHAKQFLKPEVTEAAWNKDFGGQQNPIQEAMEYLPFAWDKANGCRGLSANRSLCHLRAWLWLAGVDVDTLIPDYELYGKPQLVAISQALGVNWATLDDGTWTNDEAGPSIPEKERLTKIEAALLLSHTIAGQLA